MNKNKLLQEQNTHIDKCDQSIQRAVTHRERARETNKKETLRGRQREKERDESGTREIK